jgi:APA family basic amino acid/polyamine antiporter
MGASRLIFSMSHFKLVSDWFNRVQPRYRTPINAIAGFSMVSIVLTILSFLTPRALDTLGNLYAFGATLGYTMVFASLIRLRFSDPYSPRPYKVPGNIKWKRKDGSVILVPIIGFIGLLGVFSIWVTVLATHEIGRIVGPLWVLACIGYYVWFRRKNRLPVRGSVPHDWEKEQIDVLTSAEEYELVEQYKAALVQRDKERGVKSRWSDNP